METKLRPARVVKPGDILREELDARGWTQKDFAAIIARPAQTISEIAQGRKSITPETAILFAQALGTSPEMWLNLETAFRLRLAEQKLGDTGVALRAARLAENRRRQPRAKRQRKDRSFRITVKQQDDRFVARCVELRLQAVGSTARDALDKLATAISNRQKASRV